MLFFFFNDTATTEIYTLSLHDALPILVAGYPDIATSKQVIDALVEGGADIIEVGIPFSDPIADGPTIDRKSTRLNSSHANISYAVFCLKKKKILPFTTLLFTSLVH